MTEPLRSVTYCVPKAGNRDRENEDSAARCESQGRFAVSDGASAAMRAKDWSDLLVRSYCADPMPGTAIEAAVWAERVAAAMPISHQSGVPDYLADRMAAKPSFATLCGLVLSPSPRKGGNQTWEAVALGDSCLFHVRDDACIQKFPISSHEDFDDNPPLLSTSSEQTASALRHLRTTSGVCAAGDTLLLCTDALAEWALRESAVTEGVWAMLTTVDHRRFHLLIETLRDADAIENDDCTLLRYHGGPSHQRHHPARET